MGSGASPAPLKTDADRAFDDALALGEIKDAKGNVVTGGLGIFGLRAQFKKNFEAEQAKIAKERTRTKAEADRLEDLRARQARVDAFREQSQTRSQFLSETKANVPIREAREKSLRERAQAEAARATAASKARAAEQEQVRQKAAAAEIDRRRRADSVRAQQAASAAAAKKREQEARRRREKAEDKP
jgi:hypothetical protein